MQINSLAVWNWFAVMVLLESMIYFAFKPIRRDTGGYHATTETRCPITFTLSISFVSVLKCFELQSYLLILTVFSVASILGLYPLGSPGKTLLENEVLFLGKNQE